LNKKKYETSSKYAFTRASGRCGKGPHSAVEIDQDQWNADRPRQQFLLPPGEALRPKAGMSFLLLGFFYFGTNTAIHRNRGRAAFQKLCWI
jgi:hypothetical protein